MADEWLGHKCIDFSGGGSGQAESHQVASGRRANNEGAKGVLAESGRANFTCCTVFPGLVETLRRKQNIVQASAQLFPVKLENQ